MKTVWLAVLGAYIQKVPIIAWVPIQKKAVLRNV